MEKKESNLPKLGDAVIRICPACGIVNPAGPSDTCHHLQLVRFDGVDEELESLLEKVAGARRKYNEHVSKLKELVVEATRSGVAEVETTRKARHSEVERLYERSAPSKPLNLTHPQVPESRSAKKQALTRSRKTGAPPVDARQLDLLAQSPPKGNA